MEGVRKHKSGETARTNWLDEFSWVIIARRAIYAYGALANGGAGYMGM
jgi:hypothetical protein